MGKLPHLRGAILLAYSDLCRQRGVAHPALNQGGGEAPDALPGLPQSPFSRQDPSSKALGALSTSCWIGPAMLAGRPPDWARELELGGVQSCASRNGPPRKVDLGTSERFHRWAQKSALLSPHLSPSQLKGGDSIQPSALVNSGASGTSVTFLGTWPWAKYWSFLRLNVLTLKKGGGG